MCLALSQPSKTCYQKITIKLPNVTKNMIPENSNQVNALDKGIETLQR